MENRKQYDSDAQTLTDEQLGAMVTKALDAWLEDKEEKKAERETEE